MCRKESPWLEEGCLVGLSMAYSVQYLSPAGWSGWIDLSLAQWCTRKLPKWLELLGGFFMGPVMLPGWLGLIVRTCLAPAWCTDTPQLIGVAEQAFLWTHMAYGDSLAMCNLLYSSFPVPMLCPDVPWLVGILLGFF